MKIQNGRDYTTPYVFVEYPKWVTLADGSAIIVHNADEEAVLVNPNDDQDERASLMAKAKELGLNPHHRLGVDKLKELISKA